ncbi:lipase containing protein, putative [Entamoeba invadens IP1]|uniref:sn-1-specific diacylglycerol lipase n=1 Tax=Entamoeba invadens IP1 TaxID=370355 RepID=A0A0A1TVU6_ENTIV|nr:lipase containing protein, putative [Entamoeba invadens IP1]ELP84629.1 lipase containing protein, putative [Entamoeba invadens IP1]|eukprot:XP_004183975.1 lipase containing protein, putative [Entamoeba invadens IP1]
MSTQERRTLFHWFTGPLNDSIRSSLSTYTSAYTEVISLFHSVFEFDGIDSISGIVLLESLPPVDIPSQPLHKSIDFYKTLVKMTKHSIAAYGYDHDKAYTFIDSKDFDETLKNSSRTSIQIAYICSRAEIFPNMVLHYNFTPTLFCCAYFIALDPSINALVLSIRGTFSLNDIVSDMILYNSEFSYHGEDGVVHSGIYKTALETFKDAKDHIENALKNYPNLKFLITGHSLGGSVAQIITLLIKQWRPEWDIHCYAIAPAPIFGENLATNEEVRSLIDSVIFDSDMVPSLSMASCKHLVARMNKVLTQMDFDYLLFISKMAKGMSTSQAAKEMVEAKGIVLDDTIDTFFSPGPLWPVGEVCYMKREGDGKFSMNTAENKSFTTIRVSNTFLADHFPLNYVIVTTKLLQQLTGEKIVTKRKERFVQALEMC